MKNSIIILLSLFFAINGFGQTTFIDFSSSTNLIEIDTINPNNIWQIGRPQKSFINSAFSSDRVIITDTLNSYPTNDTSSFILKVPENLLSQYTNGLNTGHIEISFYTKYQMDTLRDFGQIEFSSDSGNTWHIMGVDFIDTSFSVWNSGWDVWTDGISGWSFNDKSFYTGQSNGWERQEISLFVCSYSHPKQEDSTATLIGCSPKSLWLKFVFMSDSISNNLDGWAIDNINIRDVQYVGIKEARNIDLIISPNPVTEKVTFSLDSNEPITISLYNFLGQQVLQQTFTNSTTISTVQLADDIYFFELSSGMGIIKTGKVIKQ